MIILLALRIRRDLRQSELGQALVAIPNLTALVLQREVEAKNGNGIREVFFPFHKNPSMMFLTLFWASFP